MRDGRGGRGGQADRRTGGQWPRLRNLDWKVCRLSAGSHAPSASHASSGFTLIELTLALALGSLAVLLGALLWRQSLSAGAALQHHRTELDLRTGGHRWLATAVGSIEAGAQGDIPFTGHPTEASFSTWLPGARGWPERQGVSIGVGGQALEARLSDGATIPLADSVGGVRFDYLLQPGLNAQWAQAWESPVSAPLAIRVRITGFDGAVDTLLFLVGSRG